MMPHANTTVRGCPGDLWQFYAVGEVIAIPTNGIVKSNGDAVMGAGLAKDAASRFPDLPKWLGDRLKQFGNAILQSVRDCATLRAWGVGRSRGATHRLALAGRPPSASRASGFFARDDQ